MIYSSCNELYSSNRILWLLSPLTLCKTQHSLMVIRSLARFSLVKYSSVALSPHPILTLQKITLHHPTALSYKWVVPQGRETLRWSNTRRWKTGSLLREEVWGVGGGITRQASLSRAGCRRTAVVWRRFIRFRFITNVKCLQLLFFSNLSRSAFVYKSDFQKPEERTLLIMMLWETPCWRKQRRMNWFST